MFRKRVEHQERCREISQRLKRRRSEACKNGGGGGGGAKIILKGGETFNKLSRRRFLFSLCRMILE